MLRCDIVILSPPTLFELDLARNRKVAGFFCPLIHSHHSRRKTIDMACYLLYVIESPQVATGNYLPRHTVRGFFLCGTSRVCRACKHDAALHLQAYLQEMTIAPKPNQATKNFHPGFDDWQITSVRQ